MKIQAALLRHVNEPLSVQQIDLDENLGPGEVLVKMSAVGACRSDYSVMSGSTKHNLPAVVGHEGAGIIEKVGPGAKWSVGDQVILNWAPNCGDRCEFCLTHRPNLCVTYEDTMNNGTMMSGETKMTLEGETVYRYSSLGCLTTHLVLDQDCCVPVSHKVPAEVAALIGCAVTTGIGSVINSTDMKPGDTAVVFGMGGVGLSVLLGAKLIGAKRIIAVDRESNKKDLCMHLGATDFVVATSAEETLYDIKQATGGQGAHYSFDAIGSPAVQEQCIDSLRRGGTAVLVGLTPMGTHISLKSDVVVRKGLKVIGSYYGDASTARDFRLYSQFYLDGKLNLDDLITERLSGLSQVNLAFEKMLAGEGGRSVIQI